MTNATEADANQTSSLETDYPFDFCVVSGNDFGEDPNMIPYVHVYNGTPIKFVASPACPGSRKIRKDTSNLHEGRNRSLG